MKEFQEKKQILTLMKAEYLETQRQINTLDKYLRDNFSEFYSVKSRLENDIEKIDNVLKDYFETDFETIMQRKRNTDLILIRHVIIYTLYVEQEYTLKMIGKYCNGRHYSTIINSVKIGRSLKDDRFGNPISRDVFNKIIEVL